MEKGWGLSRVQTWFNKAGIKAKLFLGFAAMVATALVLVFICLMALDTVRMARELARTEQTIRDNIIQKGKQLAFNSSVVMRSLAEENSISLIREIVASAMDGDSDIVYGIFMDSESKPWVMRDRMAGSDSADLRTTLLDSMSRWAASLSNSAHHSRMMGSVEIIEFAAPVQKGNEKFGIIRFGLTTKSMHEAFLSAKLHSREARKQTVFLFLLAAAFTFLVALVAATVVAGKITRPITDLKSFAIRMAGGDYELRVQTVGEDEIAVMAESFETMRLKIKDYMQNLHDLVEAKVHQVRDILENIEQGLFTFDLNLKINDDCSKNAAVLLGLPHITGLALSDVLRLTPKEEALFRDWIGIASKEHGYQRWRKISRLAPMHEILIGGQADKRNIVLEYQKIVDRGGRLSGVMVLATDVTESRKTEMRLQQEKIQHEKTVKIFMGISRHAPEIFVEFMKDSTERMRSVKKKLTQIEDAPPSIQQAWASQIFKDCHTIKGNAGAFGFESLALAAENFEVLLQDSALAKNEVLAAQIPSARKALDAMIRECGDINEVFHILVGNAKDITVRITESKVKAIREMAEAMKGRALTPEISGLVSLCRRLGYQTLFAATTKYRELVKRAAMKAGKSVEFIVTPPELEVDPKVLTILDEALVHLLRNAVAHGVEGETSGIDGRKAKGKIIFRCALSEDGCYTFAIEDDGPGIDIGTLAEKAFAAGIITRENFAVMTEQEKLGLVFLPGLSANPQSDSLSGRGLGMSIVADCIRLTGGQIMVKSSPGMGTHFIITIPV